MPVMARALWLIGLQGVAGLLLPQPPAESLTHPPPLPNMPPMQSITLPAFPALPAELAGLLPSVDSLVQKQKAGGSGPPLGPGSPSPMDKLLTQMGKQDLEQIDVTSEPEPVRKSTELFLAAQGKDLFGEDPAEEKLEGEDDANPNAPVYKGRPDGFGTENATGTYSNLVEQYRKTAKANMKADMAGLTNLMKQVDAVIQKCEERIANLTNIKPTDTFRVGLLTKYLKELNSYKMTLIFWQAQLPKVRTRYEAQLQHYSKSLSDYDKNRDAKKAMFEMSAAKLRTNDELSKGAYEGYKEGAKPSPKPMANIDQGVKAAIGDAVQEAVAAALRQAKETPKAKKEWPAESPAAAAEVKAVSAEEAKAADTSRMIQEAVKAAAQVALNQATDSISKKVAQDVVSKQAAQATSFAAAMNQHA